MLLDLTTALGEKGYAVLCHTERDIRSVSHFYHVKLIEKGELAVSPWIGCEDCVVEEEEEA